MREKIQAAVDVLLSLRQLCTLFSVRLCWITTGSRPVEPRCCPRPCSFDRTVACCVGRCCTLTRPLSLLDSPTRCPFINIFETNYIMLILYWIECWSFVHWPKAYWCLYTCCHRRCWPNTVHAKSWASVHLLSYSMLHSSGPWLLIRCQSHLSRSNGHVGSSTHHHCVRVALILCCFHFNGIFVEAPVGDWWSSVGASFQWTLLETLPNLWCNQWWARRCAPLSVERGPCTWSAWLLCHSVGSPVPCCWACSPCWSGTVSGIWPVEPVGNPNCWCMSCVDGVQLEDHHVDQRHVGCRGVQLRQLVRSCCEAIIHRCGANPVWPLATCCHQESRS